MTTIQTTTTIHTRQLQQYTQDNWQQYIFLEKASRSAVMKYTINSQIYVLTLECGTDRLSLNVGTELPYYSA